MRVFDGYGFGQAEVARPTWGEPGTPEEYGSTYAARVYDEVTKKPVAGAVVYLQMTTPTGLRNVAKATSDASGLALITVPDADLATVRATTADMLFFYTGVRGYRAGKAYVSGQETIDLPLTPLAAGPGIARPGAGVVILIGVALVAAIGIYAMAKK